jgi:hypothetical protein
MEVTYERGRPYDEDGNELESVECPSCAGLAALRETCDQCEQTGRILRPYQPGHQTLSEIRSRMGGPDKLGRYGEDPNNPRTGPIHNDPLWVGTENIG